jgi:hypothetical protein
MAAASHAPGHAPTAAPVIPVTRAEFDALQRQVADLQRWRAQLEAPARADAALVQALFSSVGGLSFTCRSLWELGQRRDERLLAVLSQLLIDSPAQLGKKLQQLAGRDCAGLQVRRLGRGRTGAVWMIVALD